MASVNIYDELMDVSESLSSTPDDNPSESDDGASAEEGPQNVRDVVLTPDIIYHYNT